MRDFILHDNSGELTQFVKRCDVLLNHWDDDLASTLIQEVTSNYKIQFSSCNSIDQITDIRTQLLFALQYL